MAGGGDHGRTAEFGLRARRVERDQLVAGFNVEVGRDKLVRLVGEAGQHAVLQDVDVGAARDRMDRADGRLAQADAVVDAVVAAATGRQDCRCGQHEAEDKTGFGSEHGSPLTVGIRDELAHAAGRVRR
ncbi:hypothetical protein D3C81_1675630 [compost metagenome]